MKTSKLNKILFYLLIIIIIIFHYEDILNFINKLLNQNNSNKVVNQNNLKNVKPNISKKQIKQIINKVENEENIPPNKLIKLGIMYQYGLNDKPINYLKSIDFYNKAINSEYADKAYYHIGKLYYEGCGELKPDGLSSIDNLLKSLHKGNYYALLMLGDIYANGVHPHFQPNKVAAKELYELIINNENNDLINTRLRNDAKQKYINLNKMEEDNHNERDGLAYIESFDTDADSQLPNDIVFQVRNFLPLDNPLKYQVGNNYIRTNNNNTNNNNYDDRALLRTADNYLQNNFTEITNNGFFNNNVNVDEQQTIFNSFEQNNTNNNRNRPNNDNNDDINNIIWNIENLNINNDSQNVHDHNLLDYAVKGINKLKNLYKNDNNNNNLRDKIVGHLNNSSLQEEEKRNVIDVFNKMGSNNRKHSRLNINETELLDLTLKRIDDPINLNNRQNLIDNLLLNMSSGVEKSFPVCSTGRMMRVLGSLDKTDAENIVELKPSWALDEELSTIVGTIRDNNLNKCNSTIKEKYDNGDDDNEIQNLIDNIKNDVRNKCLNDYVNSGILSNEELELKLEPLFNNL